MERDVMTCSGCRVQGAGFRVQGSGFRVQGSGSRVQGSGFRVQGAGLRVGDDLRVPPQVGDALPRADVPDLG